MSKKIYKKGYISEIDSFLREFDKNCREFPQSRKNEVKKHQKIFAKRDGIVESGSDYIWESFR